ncbi:hypothetical protein ACFLV3_03635 [Chloroflexota bacterium]
MAIWGEKVYVPAIMGASGVTKEQAKTCLYYAVATYLIPEKISLMPLLTLIGPIGTGKTDLLTQLSKMVKEPKIISAKTMPVLRDKLTKTTTAIIDEAQSIMDEELNTEKIIPSLPHQPIHRTSHYMSLKHILKA